MSMNNKLKAAAAAAACEAVEVERGRTLWCLDKVIEELEADLSKKLLVESERHLIQTKLAIAKAIAARVRRMIASDLRPTTPNGERTDNEGAEEERPRGHEGG